MGEAQVAHSDFVIKEKFTSIQTSEKSNGEILENQKPFEKSNKNQNKSNQIAFKSKLTFSGIKR